MAKSAIIVGAGPFISLSLAKSLAEKSYNIGLISRTASKLQEYASEIEKQFSSVKVVVHAADAGESEGLTKALDAVKAKLGEPDILCYNAARVAESDLMSLDQKTLENDFKIAVCGMNTASQWYAKNADKSDNPLLLLTSGVLHEQPFPQYGSLCTVKAASYNLSQNFAQVLPDKFGIKVGIPCIVEPIIPDGKGGYKTEGGNPNNIVKEIFMPFVEGKAAGNKDWIVQRVMGREPGK